MQKDSIVTLKGVAFFAVLVVFVGIIGHSKTLSTWNLASTYAPVTLEGFGPKFHGNRLAMKSLPSSVVEPPFMHSHKDRIIRRHLDPQSRARQRNSAYSAWLSVHASPTTPLPPSSAYRPVPHSPRFVAHLPGGDEKDPPCSSGCDIFQTRALKTAEDLVEMARRTHEARLKSAEQLDERNAKVIRSLQDKLSHILPDSEGRCMHTKECPECQVRNSID